VLENEKTPSHSGVSVLNSRNSVPAWHDYDVLGVLGEGSYGKIYKVRERAGEKRVLVIKEIDCSALRSDYEALGEIDVMARMDSPFIVKYYDSFIQKNNKVNIVMEYCEHGDLHQLLRKRRDPTDESKHKYLSENRVWSLFI
jgi:NIMA (never in mitosis gene a)-related kinase